MDKGWLKEFKKIAQWVLAIIFGGGVVWGIVIIWQDVVTSHLGWGVVIQSLNPEIGDELSWAASFLPTLVQMIWWAGRGAESKIVTHGTFKGLTLLCALSDTVADAIALGSLDYVAGGDWGKLLATGFVVVVLYGILSEFLFLFCLTSLVAQWKELKLSGEFEERQTARTDLGGLTDRILRGDSAPAHFSSPGPDPVGPRISVTSRPSRASRFPSGSNSKGRKP